MGPHTLGELLRSTAWIVAMGTFALLLACASAREPQIPVGVAVAPAPPNPVVPLPPCERVLAIEVSKRERRLRAHCAGGATVEMTVAFGRADGPKRAAGDARTPEGYYRISGPARSSRFHRFVPIDYPSLADAATARAEGRLSEPEYWRIASAHGMNQPPPADTALGGRLGFHGEGERWRGDSPYLDWTYGCIALSDADVDFLAAHSAVGTPVVIEP